MHTRELVELAALVSAQAPALVSGRGRISPAGMEQYWAASKCRLDRWARSLRNYSIIASGSQPATLHWELTRPVVEEIVASEMLTRVWCGLTLASDRRRDGSEMEPIARSILSAHVEVRNRALEILIHGRVAAEECSELNLLRRRVERWTDLLIAHIVSTEDVSCFAINPERSREFAEDLNSERQSGSTMYAWSVLLVSLRCAFQDMLQPFSPNSDMNCRIASSILACFQSDLFDSTGSLHSLWALRMMNTATDAQGLLDELLKEKPTPSCTGRALSRQRPR